jgi:type II secretory pathway predicted ATPase ExeA
MRGHPARRHAAHNEAVARITWCITERAIGVITGEVGAAL